MKPLQADPVSRGSSHVVELHLGAGSILLGEGLRDSAAAQTYLLHARSKVLGYPTLKVAPGEPARGRTKMTLHGSLAQFER